MTYAVGDAYFWDSIQNCLSFGFRESVQAPFLLTLINPQPAGFIRQAVSYQTSNDCRASGITTLVSPSSPRRASARLLAA